MTDYRRSRTAGASWFLTVNLARRRDNHLLVERIELLRDCVSRIRRHRPFEIEAMVVLPNHWHGIWTLPEGDADLGVRISRVKSLFSRSIPATESRSASRVARGERGIWQRRFWEHQIRDEADFNAHVDYIHFNPVKHGLVERVADWPYSSFHRFVARGILPADWVSAAAAARRP